MPRFNWTPVAANVTTNFAGGQAFTMSPELELVSLMLTNFVQDQYYRKAEQSMDRLVALMQQVEPTFAAKAALFVRKEFGMRSITHIAVAQLAHQVKKTEWVRPFVADAIDRVDDITEIMAYYLNTFKKPIPNALRRGLADSIQKFDEYQLAKYRGETRQVKLIDVVNLCRPTPQAWNRDVLKALVNNTLRSTDTWESRMTQAGVLEETVENETEEQREARVLEAKGEVWSDLIRSEKIGYFALLRNLSNIIEQAPDAVLGAAAMLAAPGRVLRSRVLPFRYLTAYDEIAKLDDSNEKTLVLRSLEHAMDIALSNVPELPGDMLIAVDVSGSMGNGNNLKIACLFAAALYRANPNSDVVSFSQQAIDVPLEGAETLGEVIQRVSRSQDHAGTNLRAVFGGEFTQGEQSWRLSNRSAVIGDTIYGRPPSRPLNKAYTRIVIISDGQAWVGYDTPDDLLALYKRRTGADPHIYSFDVTGYGTLQFPQDKVYAIAGVSGKVFDIIKLLEQDREAMVNLIKAVPLRGLELPATASIR